jgi:hypothetical protein
VTAARPTLALLTVLALLGTGAAMGGAAVATTDPSSPQATCRHDGVDADEDGLSDACEAALLERFAPTLVASPRACNWDAAAGRLRGGYLVGAERIERGVRLAYLPAYLEDCGWSGPKCLLRLRGGCDPHRGDSEAVFIDLVADSAAGGWAPRRLFLSAHCFGGADGRCRWYDRAEVAWFGDTPIVWVAEGKNANYPTKAACDSGHWGFDTCDRNTRAFRFPVDAPRNIGSVGRPFPRGSDGSGCLTRPAPVRDAGGEGKECIWIDERFRGWSTGAGRTSTGYRRYLRDVAVFIPPPRTGRTPRLPLLPDTTRPSRDSGSTSPVPRSGGSSRR